MKKRLIFCIVLLVLVQTVFAQDNSKYDLNGDGKITFADVKIIAQNFLKSTFDPRTDVNNDGSVNLFDLVLSARHIGQTVEATLQDNLIRNPSFETRDASGYPLEWTSHSDGAASLTTATPANHGNYAAKYSITAEGTNVQVFQYDIAVEANTEYLLSFDAYSNTGHDMDVSLLQHVPPFSDYGLSETVDIGTNWQSFSLSFYTNSLSGRASVSDARLRFYLKNYDADGDVYWFDNVVLKKVGEAPIATCPDEFCDPVSEDCNICPQDCACPPTCTPTTEICDGVDNDCDGNIDEGCDPPPSNSELLAAGYLDATTYGADPTGAADSTSSLINAIEAARDRNLATYLPPGTYLVSNTLKVVKPVEESSTRWRQTRDYNLILQGDPYNPPTIKLKDFSSGFTDSNNPKPIIWFWSQKPGDDPSYPWESYGYSEDQGQASAFEQLIKDINIDVGRGNAGAIGIRFPAAQGSYIQNVKVYSSSNSDFYAGFFKLPSRNMGAVNIEVIGGRYGIHFGETPHMGPLSIVIGARLIDQTERAIINNDGWAPNVVVGFEIQKQSTPVIETAEAYYSSSGTLALMDGTIEVQGGSAPAISNPDGQSLYVRNVFIKGTNNLVKSSTRSTVQGSGIWDHIEEYSYADKKASTHPTYNLIDGVVNQNEYVTIDSRSPPTNLVSRHIPSMYWFQDAVSVKDYGAKGDGTTDDSQALQNAIDNEEILFLPKGEYIISRPLVLGTNTILFGASKSFTHIIGSDTWKITSETPLITTVNDPDATTYISEFAVEYPVADFGSNYFNCIEWKAGRNSVIYSIRCDDSDWVPKRSPAKPHSELKATGNAGGRWYFVLEPYPLRSENQGYRMFTIENTHEPLILYGMNFELGNTPHVEIKNSQNILWLGAKAETGNEQYLRLVNSQNVAFIGFGGHLHTDSRGESTLGVYDSDNILFALHTEIYNEVLSNVYLLREYNTGSSDYYLTKGNLLALYKKGTVDFSVFDP